MALPVTISGLSTVVAPVGPFKVAAATYSAFDSIYAGSSLSTLSIQGGATGAASIQAQTFAAVKTGVLDQLKVNMNTTGTVIDGVYCEIWATSAGAPTGSGFATSDVIASSTITSTTSDGQVVTFNFQTPASLSSGTTYAVVFKRTGARDTLNYLRLITCGNPYAAGSSYQWDTSWTAGTVDVLGLQTSYRVTVASDAYYFFGRDGTTATTLRAFQSTAPDTSWTAGATKTGFTTAILTLSGYQVGTTIHLLVCDGTAATSVATKYVSYDLLADTFLATTETVAAAAANTGQVGTTPVGCAIVVRTNGEVVALYNGLQTKTSGTFRARMYYRRRTAVNTWSTETQVDSNTAIDNQFPVAVAGGSSRVHFFWQGGATALYYRTLTAANSIGASTNNTTGMIMPGDGVYYMRGATGKIAITNGDSTPQKIFYSDDADSLAGTIATPTAANAQAPHRIGVDPTTLDVSVIYRNSADSDLYAIKSTNDSVNWGAATSFFVGTVANADIAVSRSPSGSMYQRGSSVVIGYVVNDNGTWKYNEYLVRIITTADAWDASDKSANITLSNSDKTATISTGGSNVAVRSTTAITAAAAGLNYAEIKINALPVTIGLKSKGATLTDVLTSFNIASSSGSCSNATTTLATLGAFAVNDVICLAWKGTGKLLWVRKNGGLWNNDAAADPATSTNGMSSSILGTDAALWFLDSTLNSSVTVRTRVADFTLTPPAGFTSWMGETTDGWDSNDKYANHTLSNNDKTVTTSIAAGNTRSTRTNITGKYYVELVPDRTQIGNLPHLGLKNKASVRDSLVDSYALESSTGKLWVETSPGSVIIPTGLNPTDVLSIAWDADAAKIWFRKNSDDWNPYISPSDPAAGTGSYSSTLLSGDNVALFYGANNANTSTTIRTRAAELTQTTPSGFLSWMGETLTVNPNVTVNVTSPAITASVGTVSVSVRTTANVTGLMLDTSIGVGMVDDHSGPVPVIVFSRNPIGGTSEGGWAGYTSVERLSAASMFDTPGERVRIAIYVSGIGAGDSFNAYFGKAAITGDEFDFASTPTRIKWGGGNTYTAPSTITTETLTSDWTTLLETYDGTIDYAFAIEFAGGSISSRNTASTGNHSYWRGEQSAGTVDKTGFTKVADTLKWIQMIAVGQSAVSISVNVTGLGLTTSVGNSSASGKANITLSAGAGAGAWSIVGVSSLASTATTTLTMTEPAGVASSDLLVASISLRHSASSTSVTLPSGWSRVGEQKGSDTGTTGSSTASACMAYIVRGASAPALGFTLPGANVALGRIVAYRGGDPTTPLDVSAAATTPTFTTSINVAGLTTTVDNDLLVGMVGSALGNTYFNFRATDPATGSPNVAGDTTPPSTTAWRERSDDQTTTGADTALAIFDAIKATAGATGNFLCSAGSGNAQPVIVGAFKIAVATNLAVTASVGTVTVTATTSTTAAVTTPTLSALVGNVTVSTVARTDVSVPIGGAPWTPADVGADLIAWYDFAATATVIQSGGFLTQWQDKSGNARHGNPASPTVLSVNSDGIYIANATSGPNLVIQMPTLPSKYFDMAFAGKPNPFGSYRTLMANATGNFHHVLLETGNDKLGTYSLGSPPGFFQAGSLTWPSVDGQIYFSGPDATSLKIGRDGDNPLDEIGEDFAPDANPALLNYGVGGGQGFGTAREFVFMTASRSADIRDKVSGYLAWKWDAFLGVTTHVAALPAGHPYKSVAPGGVGTSALIASVGTVSVTITTSASTTAATNLLTTAVGQVTVNAKASVTTVAPAAIAALVGNVTITTGITIGVSVPVGGLWTPVLIPTNLKAWFDAADATQLTFGGPNLTVWGDKSPTVRNATPTGAAGPTLTTVNGLSSLRFDNQPLKINPTQSFGNFTAFAVFYADPSPTGARSYERLADHNSANGWWMGRYGLTEQWGGGVKSVTDPYGYHVTLPSGQVHELSIKRIGSTQYTSGNGGAVTNSGVCDGGATTADFVWIATEGALVSSLYGVISELIVWSTDLLTADQATVEGYLAWKWGIQAKLPAGHTYKSAAPGGGASTALTAAVGTVTVNAKASTTVTGNPTTVAVGNVTIVGKANTTITGTSLATAVGAPTVTVPSANGFNIITGRDLYVYAALESNNSANLNTDPTVNPVGFDDWYAKPLITAVNVSVNVTGVSLTADIGTATVSLPTQVTVTTNLVTTAVGTVTVTTAGNIGVSVAGQSLATAIGLSSVSIPKQVQVGSLQLTTAVGNVTVNAAARVDVTGQAITSANGGVSTSVGIGVSVNVSGQALTTAVNGVTHKLAWQHNITGQVITPAVGTVTITQGLGVAPPVTSPQLTTAVGNVTLKLGYQHTVDGQAITALAGGVSVSAGGSITASVSSPTITTAVGQVDVNTQQKLTVTGQAITVTIGPLAPVYTQTKVSVSGQQITSATSGAASVGVQTKVDVTGQQIAAIVSPVTMSLPKQVQVTGNQVAVTTNTANANTQQKIDVTGQQITTAIGGISATAGGSISTTVASPTLTASTSVVSITSHQNINVTGLGLTATIGITSASPSTIVNVTGLELTIAEPVATTYQQTKVSVTGQSLATAVGKLPVLVYVTGQQVTASTNSVAAVNTQQKFTPAGVEATVVVGGVSVFAGGALSTTVTGLGLTTAVGIVDVFAQQKINVTGLGITTATRSVLTYQQTNVDVAGQELTIADPAGITTYQQTKVSVTGQAISVSVGKLPVLTYVTGQQLAVATNTPTVTTQQKITVDGQELTTAVNAVLAGGGSGAVLSGQALPTAVGEATVIGDASIPTSITPSLAVAVGGVNVVGKATASVVSPQIKVSAGNVYYVTRGDMIASVSGQQIIVSLGNYEIFAEEVGASVWTGAAWVNKPIKAWNGNAWVKSRPKVWTGSAWVI